MDIRPDVLIVDDNSSFRTALGMGLQRKGYNVVQADNEKKALELLSQKRFDAVLLDVVLPGGGSGYDVLQKIRLESSNASPSVVVVTGIPESPDIKPMLMYGVDGYVEKKARGTLKDILKVLEKKFGPVPAPPPGELVSLAKMIRQRKKLGNNPFVLFLGAGASITSGCSSLTRIVDDFVDDYLDWGVERICNSSFDEKMDIFEEWLETVSIDDHEGFLSKHLEYKEISKGHKLLARFIREGYFRLVLTTNIDSVVEAAQTLNGQSQLTSLVCGKDNEQYILDTIKNSNRPIFLKLHGDIQSRKYLLSRNKIFEFDRSIEKILAEIFGNDVLVVGHGFRDLDIIRCLLLEGGKIWSINPSRPTSPLTDVMKCRKSANHVVKGLYGRFDTFMEYLGKELLGEAS